MESDVYTQIKQTVKKLLGIDLNYYKEEQVKRRLDSWLIRNGMADWDSYFHLVANNPKELSRFRDYLTINVTEFFRDVKHWEILEKEIFPIITQNLSLRAPLSRELKIWSAGCSIGVEAYTLMMIAEKMLPHSNSVILATDIDRGALQKAKMRGPYLPEEARNLSDEQKMKYMEVIDGKYFVKEKYSSKVRFSEQDLLMGSFDNNFDLIVCRNVVIYFTSEAKMMLYKKFYQALRPGGVLFVGGTELIPRPADYGFKNVGISHYMKI